MVAGYNQIAAAVNNGIMDPFQGYDVDVFALDQATGKLNLVGRFASIRITVRNNIEQYIEFNQRVERNLDGIMQFGWVLERGMLDARSFEQTFGYRRMTRTDRFNRLPRLQLSFTVKAVELNDANDPTDIVQVAGYNRSTVGEYILTYCVPVEYSIDAVGGKAVVANRWSGMAEGIEAVQRTRDDARLQGGVTLDGAQGNVETRARPAAFPWDGNLISRPYAS